MLFPIQDIHRAMFLRLRAQTEREDGSDEIAYCPSMDGLTFFRSFEKKREKFILLQFSHSVFCLGE